MIILPQGWTNSVLEFIQIVKKALTDYISHDYDIYVDDVLVKAQGQHTIRRRLFLGFNSTCLSISRSWTGHFSTLK